MSDEKRLSEERLEWWLARYEEYDRDCPLRSHIAAQSRHISELEKSLGNARKQQSDYAAAGVMTAEILAGDSGNIGEGIVEGAKRVVAERDEWRRRAEALLQQAEGLESELARLTPSGQVAEDEAIVKAGFGEELMPWDERLDRMRAAIARLAAKAQGYEGLSTACVAISKSIGFTGPSERLAEAVESAMDLGRATHAEYQRSERERLAAVADNAALLQVLLEWLEADGDAESPDLKDMTPKQRTAFVCYLKAHDVSGRPHPGTALLEEHRKALELANLQSAEHAQSATRAWDAAHESEQALEACREHVRQTGEEHRKALVRARNEGLEKAAAHFYEGARRMSLKGASASRGEGAALHEYAEIIRAMKEPEQ